MTKKIDRTKLSNEEFKLAYFSRFSDYFRNIHDIHQSLMAFGVATDKGWHNLIWELTEGIEKELKKNPLDGFEIIQVKEKFGGLRFYVSHGSNKIFKLINKAEELSFKTCERCGAPGEIDTSHSWYLTLCKKCKAVRDEELVVKRGV